MAFHSSDLDSVVDFAPMGVPNKYFYAERSFSSKEEKYWVDLKAAVKRGDRAEIKRIVNPAHIGLWPLYNNGQSIFHNCPPEK